MNSWTLIWRSLLFRARTNIWVILGSAAGTTALVGALLVGHSIQSSLLRKALQAIGPFDYALAPGDRFFSDSLPASLQKQLSEHSGGNARSVACAVLVLPGIVSIGDGSARANNVNVVGVGEDFFRSFGNTNQTFGADQALLNAELAGQLNARAGAEVLVRIQKPGLVSREVTLTERNSSDTTLRLKVAGIASGDRGGDFSLLRSQLPPRNIFVKREILAAAIGMKEKANLLAVSLTGQDSKGQRAPDLNGLVKGSWSLADTGLEIRKPGPDGELELRSSRVFLEKSITEVAVRAPLGGEPRILLTYLANLLQLGTNHTPYSFVTAAGRPYVPTDARNDEIVINKWLADDLGAKPGDRLSLSYFLPESGANLREATNVFRVRSVVRMELPWADKTLLPDFPGIEKAESTGDWQVGFELTYKIRPKDEAYWRERRGTPKAFVTASAGRRMWANRFGDCTAIRWQVPPASNDPAAMLEHFLLSNLNPTKLGLTFQPIRAEALRAVAQSQDFGGLFLGFSLFVIAAAVMLVGLLFQFNVEQRAEEVGIFLGLGFGPSQTRRYLLYEGAALAFIGALLGAVGGFLYAKAMLWALANMWRDAVGTSALIYSPSFSAILVGVVIGTFVACISIWLSVRKLARQPALDLLVEGRSRELAIASGSGKRAVVVALAALFAAISLIIWAIRSGPGGSAGAFFGGGSLLLVAGISAVSFWLVRLAAGTHRAFSSASLAIRGIGRRKKRTLTTVALLASGCFIIAAVSAFRLDAKSASLKRDSGTGGFALIGESTIPVLQDLNTRSGREFFGLDADALHGVEIVPFRVRQGDEASCLNLNRAQKPRVLGVKPELLKGRFRFAAVENRAGKIADWNVLAWNSGSSNEIAAVGDQASIQWALGSKVGGTIPCTDENGRSFNLRIVGAVANSILQGNLLIDEAAFLQKFPSETGYRYFLVDAPTGAVAQVSATLSRALQDVGLELTPAVQRLQAFNAVQNTYLGAFQVLGGVGLLLGSIGLGIVVLRNVMERRGELGVLVSVGFSRASLGRIILAEHAVLLALGLGLGIGAAGIAVAPALLSRVELPWGSLGLTLAAVLLNGFLWTWLSSRWALSGNLLKALRNE